ncbi:MULTISPECIES: ABC transporter permease [Gordonia]|uniref:ABC transporter permease n=1 Tax=Gordonia TaxID=2053 RepID=UPI0004ACE608|nr:MULTISPECIES: ABC transporter permease [Gordonia]MDH3008555.1 ABC transporter permease [Gordonia alkanivorans]MDH3017735.1 ABC transporter permease [Gordonia alkanivorans]MDH3021490.1 ABC transporter permease [Gordonia alkanivorans]MDH3025295.1 ABC transporter permease [Gordonia alkanivorans]MDH3043108.1 ABC transporter permease [Gordonia alkanivorans]
MNGIGDAVVRIGPVLAVAIVVLAVVAVLVNRRSGLATDTVVASVRAVVQLAALAGVLTVVISHRWASALFVVVMAVAAAWTSARRIRPKHAGIRAIARCLAPVAAPTIVVVIALALVGVLPAKGIAIIPTAGILLGGAMVTTSLAGRRAVDELTTRRGEVEAALSLGLLPRDARLEICAAASASALIPGLDQTRAVGLVTIPGAFVGMVLGGASVWAAAAMQLFVLIALLAVSSIAMLVTVELVAREAL